MSYSITYPTKILTLAITGFLFISVGVLCKFAIVPGVYILPSPQDKEVHSSSGGDRCTHSALHSPKRFEPLSAITLLCQGYS